MTIRKKKKKKKDIFKTMIVRISQFLKKYDRNENDKF
jgi:hypothetical protein